MCICPVGWTYQVAQFFSRCWCVTAADISTCNNATQYTYWTATVSHQKALVCISHRLPLPPLHQACMATSITTTPGTHGSILPTTTRPRPSNLWA